MQSKSNVVFVIIDALRARNLSCYGYSKPTTPNIDLLARQGMLFEKAFSCTNVTDSSLTSIFSGKYPINHGIISHGIPLSDKKLKKISEIQFLHEILKSQGYLTLAVDWLKRWHKRNYDVYYDLFHGQQDPHGISKKRTIKYKMLKAAANAIRLLGMKKAYKRGKARLGYGREAETVSAVAMNLIKRNLKRKFFIFIHFWDTHAIYNPPQPYVDKFYHHEDTEQEDLGKVLDQIRNQGRREYLKEHLKEAPNTDYVIAQYDGAIAYADHELGKILNFLEDHGISEKTLFVLTSDHGESLTEHGILFDHHGLYDVSIHVPLIISGPGIPSGKRVDGLVQHVDLVPTLLDILNIPISNKNMFDGNSLVPLITDEVSSMRPAIFAEEAYYERKRAVRTNDYKYIVALSKRDAFCRCCQSIHGGQEELYNLRKDPDETQNIVGKDHKAKEAIERRLLDWVKLFDHPALEKSSTEKRTYSREEEKEVIERLRKLGYME
ncbi:MAG: sulfatase [Candidatus Bathyarchaeota archaeon]|nr:MAG: sulfatase [Candidatus Bathyarchaeota archaeon]